MLFCLGMIYLMIFSHCFIFSFLCSQKWRYKVANLVEIRQNDFAYVGDWRTIGVGVTVEMIAHVIRYIVYRVILINRWIARYVCKCRSIWHVH